MAIDPIPSLKPEWPPLLECGLHPCTLDELQKLCVDHPLFKLSRRRKMLMNALRRVHDYLESIGIEGQLWIDGSFMTQKIDPDDIDFVLRADGDFYDNATYEQQEAMNDPESILGIPECHCFPHIHFSEDHPDYSLGVYMEAYWIKQWGFARQSGMKGIAVVELLGGKL